MARLGWAGKDESMTLQGRIIYSRALQSVQTSLWHENTAIHDDIFIAGYVFAVYEVRSFPTSMCRIGLKFLAFRIDNDFY